MKSYDDFFQISRRVEELHSVRVINQQIQQQQHVVYRHGRIYSFFFVLRATHS